MRNSIGSKPDWDWSVLLVMMILIGLFGCQKNEATKDQTFVSDVKRIGATLQPGQSALVPVPPLENNELLIVINGYYAGYIEPSQYVSKKLAMKISGLEGANRIFFVRDQEIISNAKNGGFLNENFGTSLDQQIANNAKVAHSETRNAVLRCVPREVKPSADIELWNPRCRIELVAFE